MDGSFRLVLLLLFSFDITFSAGSFSCPSGWTFGDTTTECYSRRSTRKTWHAAESDCENLGGHLVSITNDSENSVVMGLRGSSSSSSSDVWIGLHDTSEEGTFVWVDGTDSSHREWADGEPNNLSRNGKEEGDCVRMISSGKWRDSYCSSSYNYVCQIPAVALTDCQSGWKRSGRSCYKYFSNRKIWNSAESDCAFQVGGGHLVSIASAFENSFVYNLSGTSAWSSWSSGLWIGFHKGNAGSLVWTDGTSGSYKNWATSNSNGDCVRMLSDGKWGNYSCSKERRYMCEHSLITVTPSVTVQSASSAAAANTRTETQMLFTAFRSRSKMSTVKQDSLTAPSPISVATTAVVSTLKQVPMSTGTLFRSIDVITIKPMTSPAAVATKLLRSIDSITQKLSTAPAVTSVLSVPALKHTTTIATTELSTAVAIVSPKPSETTQQTLASSRASSSLQSLATLQQTPSPTHVQSTGTTVTRILGLTTPSLSRIAQQRSPSPNVTTTQSHGSTSLPSAAARQHITLSRPTTSIASLVAKITLQINASKLTTTTTLGHTEPLSTASPSVDGSALLPTDYSTVRVPTEQSLYNTPTSHQNVTAVARSHATITIYVSGGAAATVCVILAVAVLILVVWRRRKHLQSHLAVSDGSMTFENVMYGHSTRGTFRSTKNGSATVAVNEQRQTETDPEIVGEDGYLVCHFSNKGNKSKMESRVTEAEAVNPPKVADCYDTPGDHGNRQSNYYAVTVLCPNSVKRSQNYDSSAVEGTEDEEKYWEPASTEEELYGQLENRKFRHIERRDVTDRKEIGSGEFGVVERARWQMNKDKKIVVAVKTLSKTSEKEDSVKFLREATINGQFHHRNVVRLHGVVTAGSPLMLVLEFMSNGDLKGYLVQQRAECSEKPFPADLSATLVQMCRDVASGMAYLSRKSFVHRDLAARNILLNEKLTCKIGDFGMARDVSDDNYYITKGGKVPIRWCAPETWNYRKFSSSSDVWSYGVLLYEIWSVGLRPFGSMSNNMVMTKVENGYRLPPPPGCSLFFYQLMIDCWNPDSHERPSFGNILQGLSASDKSLTTNRQREPAIVGNLGDELEVSRECYKDLQNVYG